MERTSSRKTCQKAQPSVEENGLLNGYDDDDDDDDDEQLGSECELIVYPFSGVRLSSACPPFSKIFSETAWPIKAKFHADPPWKEGTKVYINGPGDMTKMAAMPIYMVKALKIFFSRTQSMMILKLGVQHWGNQGLQILYK